MYMPTINYKYFRNKKERMQKLKIQELYEEGKEVHEIAEELDTTVYQVRKALGLE